MRPQTRRISAELETATRIWGALSEPAVAVLTDLISTRGLSVTLGHLQKIGNNWYVTHSGLLRVAAARHCTGIRVQCLPALCDVSRNCWVFKATVYPNRTCKGFVGYGDADPSNVSEVVRGAEMRVAETRAVNRALRKAYGIGICSVEEVGTAPAQSKPTAVAKKPSCGRMVLSDKGNDDARPSLRDRLRQLIRQHQLDPILVKSYAVDFCGTKALGDASREQIQNFVDHLARLATTDREGLVTELNRYTEPQERAS